MIPEKFGACLVLKVLQNWKLFFEDIVIVNVENQL